MAKRWRRKKAVSMIHNVEGQVFLVPAPDHVRIERWTLDLRTDVRAKYYGQGGEYFGPTWSDRWLQTLAADSANRSIYVEKHDGPNVQLVIVGNSDDDLEWLILTTTVWAWQGYDHDCREIGGDKWGPKIKPPKIIDRDIMQKGYRKNGHE